MRHKLDLIRDIRERKVFVPLDIRNLTIDTVPCREFLNRVERIIAMEDELSNDVELFISFRDNARELLKLIHCDITFAIMESYYLHGLSWSEVSERFHYSRTHIFNFHRYGLEILQREFNK